MMFWTRTVIVVVDPGAGVAIEAPNANRESLEALENALTRWGRFRLVRSEYNADLVISIRRANRIPAEPTIGGIPADTRPVIVEPTTDASMSHPPPRPGTSQPPRPAPHPQIDTGPSEDMFTVYRGKREHATEFPPVWRLSQKNSLRIPDVPALEVFRKLLVEEEKRRAANP